MHNMPRSYHIILFSQSIEIQIDKIHCYQLQSITRLDLRNDID